MNGVMPVVVVVGSSAIPTAILVDQGGMVPLVAGILPSNYHSLAAVTESPHGIRLD